MKALCIRLFKSRTAPRTSTPSLVRDAYQAWGKEFPLSSDTTRYVKRAIRAWQAIKVSDVSIDDHRMPSCLLHEKGQLWVVYQPKVLGPQPCVRAE
eukprot:scaffold47109_cov17-Tisochrysis_lutea.AAC.3